MLEYMTVELTDTHCHIHEAIEHFTGNTETRTRWQQGKKVGSPDEIIAAAKKDGVTRLICVGTTLEDSELAVDFVKDRAGCWASIGIHPHEAKAHEDEASREAFANLASKPKVVAVGECGLDYFYAHSPKESQVKLLEFQMEVALKAGLPMIFHVRDAFDDFWPIFDAHPGIKGVIHSFSATTKELDQILGRGLYVGLNGIMTFTKNADQLAAATVAPLESLVVETDAPFLTPVPFRGTICEPKHVRVTAQFLADLRGETLESFATATTRNAQHLFGIA
jgi:TatD DNase family protein